MHSRSKELKLAAKGLESITKGIKSNVRVATMIERGSLSSVTVEQSLIDILRLAAELPFYEGELKRAVEMVKEEILKETGKRPLLPFESGGSNNGERNNA